MAVWDCAGKAEFYQEGSDGSRLSNEGTPGTERIWVKTVDAASILEKYSHVDFLKIDIEGAETRVLRRIAPQLSKVSNLFVEYHGQWGMEQTLDVVLHIMKEAGFRTYMESSLKASSPFMRQGVDGNFDVQMNIWGVRNLNAYVLNGKIQ